MSAFLTYIIRHIDLNKSLVFPEFKTNGRGNYLVFWWNNIGLGQFFINPYQHISGGNYSITCGVLQRWPLYTKSASGS